MKGGIKKAYNSIKKWASPGDTKGVTNNRAAQLAKNRAAGQAAEAQAAKDLVAEGNSILGSQVSVRTAEGRRVIDHLVQDANGTIRAVEVKAGGAVRNASQLAKDNALATQGGTLVGKNAPAALRGQNIVIETVETPHVHDPKIPGGVRPADSSEIPRRS